MKVALITRIMAHYREPIFSILSSQKANGFPEFTFFADKTNSFTSVKTISCEKSRVSAEEGGFDWRFIKTYNVLGCGVWQSCVLKVFGGSEFDVIILDTTIYYLSSWIGIVLAKLRKKKIIIWGHGFKRKETGIKSWLRMLQYHMVDGVLLYGKRAQNIMVDKGYDPSKIFLVYNSLDYDTQVSCREQLEPEIIMQKKSKMFNDPALPVLAYIGRLSEGKKLELLIEAASRLMGKGVLCNVLLVGDGESKEWLEQLVAELGLAGNTVMCGACYDETEISYMMGMATVCVVPDAVGLSCIHSLVYGVPVVTSDNYDVHGPEFEAIIPDRTGSFYSAGDVDSLVDELQKWLLKEDNGLVQKECMRVVDEFYNPHYQQKVINKALNDVVAV